MRHGICLLAAVLVSLVGTPVFAQNANPAASIRLVTQAEADAVAAELLPLVEKHTARKLAERPTLRVLEKSELADVIAKRLSQNMKRRLPNKDIADIEIDATFAAMEVSELLLGMYSSDTRTTYIVDDSLQRLMIAVNVPASRRDAILKLVVTHELIHAVQNQESSILRDVEASDDLVTQRVLRAVAEGMAMFIRRRIGDELSIKDANDDLDRMVWKRDGRSGGPQEFTFITSAKFIAFHHEKSGIEGVWAVLKNPPRTTREIEEPGWVAPALDPKADLKPAADRVAALMKPPLNVMQTEVSGRMLDELLSTLPAERREAMTRSVVSSRVVMAESRSPRQLFTCLLVQVDNEANAKLVAAGAQERLRGQAERMKAAGLEVSAVEVTPYEGIQGDVRIQALFTLAAPGQKMVMKAVVIARGPMVVEFTATTQEVSESFVLDVLRAAFGDLAETAKPDPQDQP